MTRDGVVSLIVAAIALGIALLYREYGFSDDSSKLRLPLQEQPPREQPLRVAIIGLGVGGIAAVKEAKEAGLIPLAFDRGDGIGGAWNHLHELHPSRFSRFSSEFSDFAWPDDSPDFPSAKGFLSYLQAYMDHFSLTPHMRFQTEVISATPATDDPNLWQLKLRSLEDGLVSTEIFDRLIVASGRFSSPAVPDIPGMDTFKGSIYRCSESTSIHNWNGQRLLVVGNTFAGYEAASDLATTAGAVLHSVRTQCAVHSKMLILRRQNSDSEIVIPSDQIGKIVFDPVRLQPNLEAVHPSLATSQVNCYAESGAYLGHVQKGRIEVVREEGPERAGAAGSRCSRSDSVQSSADENCLSDASIPASFPFSFSSDGTSVILANGSSTSIDAVFFCADPPLQLPFFDKALQEHLFPGRLEAQGLTRHLYLGTFHPQAPTAAFVGMYSSGESYVPGVEAQARAAMYVFSGTVALPDVDSMNSAIRQRNSQRASSEEQVEERVTTLVAELMAMLEVPTSWTEIQEVNLGEMVDDKLADLLENGPPPPCVTRLVGGTKKGAKLDIALRRLKSLLADSPFATLRKLFKPWHMLMGQFIYPDLVWHNDFSMLPVAERNPPNFKFQPTYSTSAVPEEWQAGCGCETPMARFVWHNGVGHTCTVKKEIPGCNANCFNHLGARQAMWCPSGWVYTACLCEWDGGKDLELVEWPRCGDACVEKPSAPSELPRVRGQFAFLPTAEGRFCTYDEDTAFRPELCRSDCKDDQGRHLVLFCAVGQTYSCDRGCHGLEMVPAGQAPVILHQWNETDESTTRVEVVRATNRRRLINTATDGAEVEYAAAHCKGLMPAECLEGEPGGNKTCPCELVLHQLDIYALTLVKMTGFILRSIEVTSCPSRGLAIGGGIGSLSMAISNELGATASIDVVEIDANTVHAGRMWFGLDPAIQVYVEDVGTLLDRKLAEGGEGEYDFIVVDCFLHYVVPDGCGIQSVGKYHSILKPGGVVIHYYISRVYADARIERNIRLLRQAYAETFDVVEENDIRQFGPVYYGDSSILVARKFGLTNSTVDVLHPLQLWLE